MLNDMMFECEQKKEFRRSGGDVWEWHPVSVSSAVAVSRDRLRCVQSRGAPSRALKDSEQLLSDSHMRWIGRVNVYDAGSGIAQALPK